MLACRSNRKNIHDPLDFDLNNIENEPTDEQLSSLMKAVADEANRRQAIALTELMARLQRDVSDAKQSFAAT